MEGGGDDGSSSTEICAVCTAPSPLKCVRCHKVYYCSKAHQKEDWKQHKKSCYPVQIKDTDDGAGVLISTRDIPQGEIIFKEKPILTGPRVMDDNVASSSDGLLHPICLDCYKIVRGNYRCTNCLWPLCGPACENGKKHAAFECSIFGLNNVPPINGRGEAYQYGSICILRGLLLAKMDPTKWIELMKLDSKVKEKGHEPGFDFVVELAKDFIIGECGQTQFDLKVIRFVAGALQTNRLSNEDNATLSAPVFGSYLYHKVSFASHSCLPNAMWFVQHNEELHLRASVPIKQGQLVTCSSVHLEDGTFTRRAQLSLHLIECSCIRCCDPTELGTYMSAVKCQNPNCDDGYYLMENPLLSNSTWKCNQSSCGRVESSDIITQIEFQVQSQVNWIDTAWSNKPNPNLLENHLWRVKRYEEFIKKNESKTLHKNHSIIFRAKKTVGYLIPQLTPYMEECNPVERMMLEEKQVGLVRDCLNLADVFWPGYSRYRGQLLYNLQRGLFCLIFSEMEKLANSRRNASYNTPRVLVLRQMFQEVLKLRKEVKEILCIEREGNIERGFADEMDIEGEDFASLRRIIGVPLQ